MAKKRRGKTTGATCRNRIEKKKTSVLGKNIKTKSLWEKADGNLEGVEKGKSK